MNVFYGSDLYLINKAVEQNNQNLANSSFFTYFLHDENVETIFEKVMILMMHESIHMRKQIIVINDYYDLIFSDEKNIKSLENLLCYQNQQKQLIIKVVTKKTQKIAEIDNVNFFFIANLKQAEFVNWLKQTCLHHLVRLPNGGLSLLAKNFPKQLLICENEIKKLANYQTPISLELLQKICDKFFQKNNFRLIDNWIRQHYLAFWEEYCASVNDDSILFLNTVYYLELIRNAKMLKYQGELNLEQICQKLKITNYRLQQLLRYQIKITKINHLLLKACAIDSQVKMGKINKDIAIALFFLNI